MHCENPGRQRRSRNDVAASLLALMLTTGAWAADGELTSPAIDPTMFRDGELRRSVKDFGGWSAVCDEVPRLRQRFCSLKTMLRDTERRMIAELIVSTGDNGRPAALLRVRIGAHIGAGARLRIETGAQPSGKKAPPRPDRRLDFVSCDARACSAVWSLAADEIKALNAGASVRIRVTQVRALSPLAPNIASPERLTLIEAVAAGAGFSQAVASTLK